MANKTIPVCSICKMEDNNAVDYGEFMQKRGVRVHYYCLLLSTHLPQNGLDQSGILGFLIRDIRKEIESCAERTCSYCHKPNASISCFECKRYFHNICANKNGCVSEFSNEFHSYCHRHVPFKDEPILTNVKKQTCWICEEPIGGFSPTLVLRAYCCGNGYVHRTCMRRYALSAGYHLKCLWCPSNQFRDDIRKHGVFVPDREATWDNNETLRFSDLHIGYSNCDAIVCLCPQGRDYFRNSWKLIVCCLCGSSGVHEKCGRKNISKKKYTCSSCANILNEVKKVNVSRRNPGYNTMFISKTYEETEDYSKMYNVSNEQENIEDEAKPSNISQSDKQQDIKDKATPSNTNEHSEEPQKSTLRAKNGSELRELYLFGEDSAIIGTVKVERDKLQQKSGKLMCEDKDIVGFSSSDKLMESIFADIEDQGRELSTDMVDEVFNRMKLMLEKFGDDDDD